MTAAIIPAVVIGGVAYTLTRQDASPPPTAPGGPTRYHTPSAGATLTQAQGGVAVAPPRTPVGASSVSSRFASPAFMQRLTNMSAYTATPNTIDPELQKKFDEAEAYAKKQFDNANEVAKGQAADYLNKELGLEPKLTGHEDWQTVTRVVAGAAGAAAGAAACSATGFGVAAAGVCGKVGALVGAYLGVELSEFMDKSYTEVKAWLQGKWGSLKEEVNEAYDDVKDAVGDAIDWINPF